MEYANVMQKPKIDKVIVNIGVGESGEKLGKAEKLLETLSGKKPVRTVSTHKIPTWGIKIGEPIGTKITLRGEEAAVMIKRFLYAKDNILQKRNFGPDGNVSFGIHEYIDIEGLKYDPDVGIFGMTITIVLKRDGYRIKHRKIKSKKVPMKHRLNRDEAIEYFKVNFGVQVEE